MRIIALLVVLLICLISVSSATVSYSYIDNEIIVSGTGDTNFSLINASINDVSALNETTTDEWLLNVNMTSGTDVNISLSSEKLFIKSNSGDIPIELNILGKMNVANSNISTRNDVTGIPDAFSVNRSYVILSGGNVTNSNITYLGNLNHKYTSGYCYNHSNGNYHITNSTFDNNANGFELYHVNYPHNGNKFFINNTNITNPHYNAHRVTFSDSIEYNKCNFRCSKAEWFAIRFEGNTYNITVNDSYFYSAGHGINLYSTMKHSVFSNNEIEYSRYGFLIEYGYTENLFFDNNYIHGGYAGITVTHYTSPDYIDGLVINNTKISNVGSSGLPKAFSPIYINNNAINVSFNNLTLCNFKESPEAAIYIDDSNTGIPSIDFSNVIISDSGAGFKNAFYIENTPVNITNAVINGGTVNGIVSSGIHTTYIKNSIIINNAVGLNGTNISSTYNDVWNNSVNNYMGTSSGTGDISSNPFFYDLTNFWLNSTSGTWNGSGWEIMSTHSPCIDAGNPSDNCANEPLPNGSRINIGVYGNTICASKSSVTIETFVVAAGAFAAVVVAGAAVVSKRVRVGIRGWINRRRRRR